MKIIIVLSHLKAPLEVLFMLRTIGKLSVSCFSCFTKKKKKNCFSLSTLKCHLILLGISLNQISLKFFFKVITK